MKRWLVRLYPRAWRQRYGEEFQAVLDQQVLTIRDVVDIVRGAGDAQRTAFAHAFRDHFMPTFLLTIRQRSRQLLLALVLVYSTGYGTARATEFLVHTTTNRYTPRSTHGIHALYTYEMYNPYPDMNPWEIAYWPLCMLESVTWMLVDSIYQPAA